MTKDLKEIHRRSTEAKKVGTSLEKKKLCVKCQKVLPLTKYFTNKDWKEQGGKDAWCRDCVADFCVTKGAIQEYCFYNNRMFSEDVYKIATERGPYEVANDPIFTNSRATQKQKDLVMNKAIAKQYFKIMSLAAYYQYTSNIGGKGFKDVPDTSANPIPPSLPDSFYEETDVEPQPQIERGETIHDDQTVYSERWWGHYTQRELRYLEEYYNQLMNDFPMDTGSVRDYAMKVAKQSLIVNDLQEKFKRGLVKISELQDSIRTFDALNQSSNFAESKRKPGDTAGIGSLGELFLKIEQSGILATRQVTFPPDDIDMLRNDLRHTKVAIGDGD